MVHGALNCFRASIARVKEGIGLWWPFNFIFISSIRHGDTALIENQRAYMIKLKLVTVVVASSLVCGVGGDSEKGSHHDTRMTQTTADHHIHIRFSLFPYIFSLRS